MFLQGRLHKTLVEPMFLHWCLHKTLVLPMFFSPKPRFPNYGLEIPGISLVNLGFYWFCQCFLLLGLKNIGKTNVFARAPSQNIGKNQCFCKGAFTKHWFYQCFSALGAENIGKTNKNHKNQDFQTMGWRSPGISLEILVFMVFIGFANVFCSSGRKTLVKPMFCEGTNAKTIGSTNVLWRFQALAKTLVLPMFSAPRRPCKNIGFTNVFQP